MSEEELNEEDKMAIDIIQIIEKSDYIQKRYISRDKIKEKIEQAKQQADDDNTEEFIKISAWQELLEEAE